MEKVTRSEFAEEGWVKKEIAELNKIIDIQCCYFKGAGSVKDKTDMDFVILDWMIRNSKRWAQVVWWTVFIQRFKSSDYDHTEPENENNGIRTYHFLWAGPTTPVLTIQMNEKAEIIYSNNIDDLEDLDKPVDVDFPVGYDVPLYFFPVGKYLTDYTPKNEEIYVFEALWRLKGLFKDISKSLKYDIRRTELFDQTFEIINKVLHIKAYPKIEWKKGIRLLAPDGRQINLKLYPNHNATENRKAMEITFVSSEMYDTDEEFLCPEVVTMYGEPERE